ncbi:ERO1-like protein alpha [Zancudomyces culisetae]|uniref:ERO1-like protein alpha n=1 Tax=Zancudomyces culisetae TaxID=1213189 RepID=A0A1R1PSA7_ZANCU|nr:ERO1-like protein alpha [Zancudomyces culisetae]OMH84952.1 ERO1-like protein alpha [Zancudomyces culisetae]|eukprot:OMH83772.1 ERO1-like protein alpha [Zancudomyces culisetae]
MTKERPDSDDEASTHNRAEVINVKTGKAVTEKASWITTGLRVATLAALVLGISYGNLVKGNKEHSPLDVESNQQPSGVDFMVQVLQKTGGRNLCSLAGYIEGTCLDFETVEAENKALHPYLEELMKSKFFRLLKVDLFKKCKLWENEDKCTQEGCTVDPVDDNEIPASWRDENEAEIEEDGQDQWNKQRFGSFLEMMEKDKVGKGHVFDKKDYSVVNNEKTGDGVWVDLYANPEKFTGYAGSTANQIWVSIYTDYCFGVQPKMQDTAAGWGSQKYGVDNKKSPFVEPPANRRKLKGFLEDLMESEREISLKSDVPRELELFYQAISGLHASTSTHICYENYDAETNTWVSRFR